MRGTQPATNVHHHADGVLFLTPCDWQTLPEDAVLHKEQVQTKPGATQLQGQDVSSSYAQPKAAGRHTSDSQCMHSKASVDAQ